MVEVRSGESGRGGTATISRGSSESANVRWYESRPGVGDKVLVNLPPPGGTRRILAVDREAATGHGVYVEDYQPGMADHTSAINAAREAAVAAGSSVLFGAGTWLFSGAPNITDRECWAAAPGAEGLAIILRSPDAMANSMLSIVADSFCMHGLVLDGNKAVNANACHLLIAVGDGLLLERCVFRNAKAVSGGYGAGVALISPVATSERHQVVSCEFTGNDGVGLYVADARRLTVRDCRLHDNGAAGASGSPPSTPRSPRSTATSRSWATSPTTTPARGSRSATSPRTTSRWVTTATTTPTLTTS